MLDSSYHSDFNVMSPITFDEYVQRVAPVLIIAQAQRHVATATWLNLSSFDQYALLKELDIELPTAISDMLEIFGSF